MSRQCYHYHLIQRHLDKREKESVRDLVQSLLTDFGGGRNGETRENSLERGDCSHVYSRGHLGVAKCGGRG